MVELDKRKDLSNMYCLLKPLCSGSGQGLSTLAETVEEQIKKEGLESLRNLKPETVHMDFVENIISVYRKYKDVVNTVFSSDQLFISALDKACTAIINHRACSKTACRSPELVSIQSRSIHDFYNLFVDNKVLLNAFK